MELSPSGDQISVRVVQNGVANEVVVDQLLIAVGRAPNIDGLNLDKVNVKYHKKGVEVNDNMQTTNPRIYAAGDICSKFQFTHAADF
jgi:pyruvate/2-oxoglutarate dehydrogenase complex dihydrolipoamide dehydrogenase (E3) component